MSNKNEKSNSITAFLSYWGLICIGLVLLITSIGLSGTLTNILNSVAIAISGIILAINASYYVKGKKTAYVVIYWVSLALVIIDIVWPIIRTLASK